MFQEWKRMKGRKEKEKERERKINKEKLIRRGEKNKDSIYEAQEKDEQL